MALQRINPLPIGRYWVDVPLVDGKEVAFREWLQKHSEHVKVISTSHRAVNPDTWGTPAIDWYLFQVTEPVQWDGPGLPTIAPDSVQSQEDTAERPDHEKDPIDKLDDALDELPSISSLMWAGGIIAAVLLAAALRRR